MHPPIRQYDRRQVLKAAGVAVTLPLFEATTRGSTPRNGAGAEPPAKRLVAVNVGLGLHAPNIVPQESGRDYDSTPYLDPLQPYRDQFTFISGVSHPSVGGGHLSGKSFLTAAKHPNSAGFTNTISIDQVAAASLGTETRFRSLALSISGPGLSWSRSGVELPAEVRPSRVFDQLFLDGKADEKQRQIQRITDGQSVLDLVKDKAKRMQSRLSGRDRRKMEQYFDSVREAEQRLVKAQMWAQRPKPSVDVPPPKDQPDRTKMIERIGLMYDMMHLALETDSTRFITFYDTGMNAVPTIAGVDTDYHMLSHHAKDPKKIAQLTIVETAVMEQLARFLGKLHDSQESGRTLLDSTMVLFGSNLGNASSHDTKNMPIILAGGGFRHQGHLAYDRDNNYPLPKLYVSMLQQLGLEVEEFAECQGTMDGLSP